MASSSRAQPQQSGQYAGHPDYVPHGHSLQSITEQNPDLAPPAAATRPPGSASHD